MTMGTTLAVGRHVRVWAQWAVLVFLSFIVPPFKMRGLGFQRSLPAVIILFYNFIYLFLALLGLPCCEGFL